MAPVGPVGPSAVGDASSLHALRAVYEELARLEEALCVGRRPVSSTATKLAQTAARGGAATGAVARGAAGHVPAWLRPTAGENRWAVAATILVAIGLQVALPDRLTLLNRWLLLELALRIALVVAAPVRFNRGVPHPACGEFDLERVADAGQQLVGGAAGARSGQRGGGLGRRPAALERGGDLADQHHRVRAVVLAVRPRRPGRAGACPSDVARFPVRADDRPAQAHSEWEPTFVDYLYLSFTNATAFSPSDTMPLTRWAKLTVPAQSLVSLVTVALVIARAVNILK